MTQYLFLLLLQPSLKTRSLSFVQVHYNVKVKESQSKESVCFSNQLLSYSNTLNYLHITIFFFNFLYITIYIILNCNFPDYFLSLSSKTM